ncbi:PBECR3 domain-containing polyvalent protein [Caldifermentibacillus hisashii]|uniref:PBECR3 domain-containing polyvalent protein n=1 Tax=Caldifermentibacillus hisashii TaxID=996558 RepID=UPI0022B9B3B1|nr:plasmid-related protein [Caldifermentibacillus hisashii]
MPSTIHIDLNATDTQLVGYIPKSIIDYYSIECAGLEVYMPPGVLKHLKKRGHWDDFVTYHTVIPDMIANPDYAGQNPKELNTVELYKVVNDHVILPIKLNEKNGLFLSSFFILDNGPNKIQRRLRTGRIYSFSFFG